MKESDIQKAVFNHIDRRGVPGVVAWAVPNNPDARRVPGFRAGAHDVHILNCGEFFSLELKTSEGKASDEQIKFGQEINRALGHAYIAYGLDEALSWLELQGIIRKAA